MTEVLDIFDDNMALIGTADRDEVHKRGYWHHTFHCWVLRRSGDQQFVVFQRRGPKKKLFPNALDITAAGHILTGERAEEGIRELNEELGIEEGIENLLYLGIRCDVAQIGDVLNREFCHTYFLDSHKELEEYNLQANEVSGLVQIEISDGLRLFSDESDTVRATGFQLDEDGKKVKVDLKISKSDIIPRLDRYYLKIFIMAKRYFDGEKYFGI